MKLLVTGGSGFIGLEICKLAIMEGYAVVSISRRGRPNIHEDWVDQVEWVSADIFEPTRWKTHLSDCDAVIHTIGILRERKKEGITFEKWNCKSAVVTAKCAQTFQVKKFIFLSASSAPAILSGYIKAKRRAEQDIASLPLRSVFLRPGFVYGFHRPLSLAIAILMRIGYFLPFLRGFIKTYYPLPVKMVAQTALQAAFRDDISGIIDIEGIKRLTTSYS